MSSVSLNYYHKTIILPDIGCDINNSFGKCIYWKSWKILIILYIKDIINETNGHFLTHKELQMKYNIKTNQILMLQIYSSIPKDWIKILNKKYIVVH